ncbi:MAG: endolytic transglycosylase MltG [Mycobacterium sp.]
MTRREEIDPDAVDDDWGATRTKPESVGSPRRSMSRAQRLRAERNRKKRKMFSRFALGVLILVVVGAVFLGSTLWHKVFGPGNDFSGGGVSDLVIEVHNGDSTTAIGQLLHDHDVVATVKAFVDAAEGNSAMSEIQPGFYKVRTEIPATDAVARLTDKNNRVGRLVIPEGLQLDDTTDVKTNKVSPGIFSLISQASCVDLDGTNKCVGASDLRQAAGSLDLNVLGIPGWALPAVKAMGTDHRRLEGLIAPGTWNVDPSGTPETILAGLIGVSAQQYEQWGLLGAARGAGLDPYQVLVVASLAQKESQPQDFAKVARVIDNRLATADHRELQFDSTVNYPLDRKEVATTDIDRARVTPWNTYARDGLPATPICSPGEPALTAALNPAPGDWLYFVTIDKQGTTLFTRDYQQHLANIELAKHNGVLDSSR